MHLVRNTVFFWAAFACLLLSIPIQSSAKTFFVERDGTGDYIVIQDAVNAAASGDTIKIGLGRFDEKHLVTCPGWSEYVRVQVTQQELTIIGSGSGTIIGQVDRWDSSQGMHKGIATGGLWGNQILRVENLRFENMRDGIYTSHEDKVWSLLEVRDCSFDGNHDSLWLLGAGGTVQIINCDFLNFTTEGLFIVGWNQMEMEIRKCDFVRLHNIYSTQAINLSGIQSVLVESCNIIESSTGVTISHCKSALLKNCLFDGQRNGALSIPMNATVSIEACQFKNQAKVLNPMTPDVYVEMTDCTIENVSDCAFYLSGIGSLSVHNCDLAGGERGVVYAPDRISCAYTARLDMTDNYWGTAEPDSIQAWIHDRNDSDAPCYWVDYEPFLTGSTPVEKKSLGGFKAMFR